MEQGRPLVEDDIFSLESSEDLTAGLVIFVIIALGCVYCMASAINGMYSGEPIDYGGVSGKPIDYSGYPARYSGYSAVGQMSPVATVLRKKSASQIQSAEARYTPGSGVAAGGRAANAQSIAAGKVAGMHSRGSMSNGGSVPKAGNVAKAQSRASHKQQFPEIWWQ